MSEFERTELNELIDEFQNKFFNGFRITNHPLIKIELTGNHLKEFVEWTKAKIDGWISVEDKLPDFIEGKSYSKNVFATNGKDLFVMNRFWTGEEGWLWGNCYGNIDGEGEADDDYGITHWKPINRNLPK